MITIPMLNGTDYDFNSYGITDRSAFIYRGARGSSALRVTAWDNTVRPNPKPEGPAEWTQFGKRGGVGRYLDPNNLATDSPITFTIAPEATVITNNGTNTGTVASGQVWAGDDRLVGKEEVELTFLDGARIKGTIRFTDAHGGYGVVDPS